MRPRDIHLDEDDGGETVIAIYIKSSKTYQYNHCAFKTLKSVHGEVCPVTMWGKYMQTMDSHPIPPDECALATYGCGCLFS